MGMDAVKPKTQLSSLLIAVVDDDPLFLKTLAANLHADGYRVATFTTTKTILAEWFEGLRPAAILIEARVAIRDQNALPRALRAVGYTGPIVLLTPEESFADIDQATQTIDKTLPPQVMLRQLTRIVDAPRMTAFNAGPLYVDHAAVAAQWHRQPVALARGEFAITALLAEHAGIPVSYREIFHAMQTDLFATGVSGEGYRMFVRAAVERIRQKFRTLDPAFAAIEHDAGIGYRWRL